MKTTSFATVRPSLLILCALAPAGAYEPTGDISELYDFTHLTRLRPGVKCKMFSSYDRTGGNNDGFSGTYSKLRVEGGRSVLAEMAGAGCIHRIWFTHSEHKVDGLLERKGERIRIFLDGKKEPALDVPLEDMFSGNLDTAPVALSGLLTAVVFYLANNEFEEAGIHQIRLKAKALEEVKYASLERVWLDKYEAAPGERIQVRIYYRTYGGETLQEAVDIDAPPLPAGSEFSLVIADAASMQQLEAGLYRSQEFVPRNFSQLVRLLNNLRKNNRIYFKMMASKPGLFLKGEEMPNLPPSIKSMFASPRATSAPTELTRSTLREYQLPIPFVFRGLAAVPVRIKQ